MSSRWTGFIVWALVAASAAFWGLNVFQASRALPADARVPARPVAVNSPMTRLFGALPAPDAPAAPPAESDRFQLQGVIAEGDQGVAILSIDNQPPKAWRVGSVVEGDTTLLSVSKRAAQFGPRGGPAAFTLELPAPAAAATGTLPSAVNTPEGNAENVGVPAARPGNWGAVPPNPNNVRGPAGMVPGVNAPGLVNRGPNGLPVMPPRAVQPPQPLQGDGTQTVPQQRDEE